MAKKCPHCGFANPDDLPFCNSCGEPIDAQLKMVMDVQNYKPTQTEKPKRRRDDDDDYIPLSDDDDDDERKFPVGIVVLAAVVVVAVVLFFVLR